MIKSYKSFLCALLLAAPTIHAMESEPGLQQFTAEEIQIKFTAADKWSDEKAFLVGGAIGGGVVGACALPSRDGATILAFAAVGAVIGGGIEYWNNGRYTKAYDAADGKTIHGAAALNNERGVQAWMNYGDSPIAQDNNKMTPLMYAAANGCYEAAQIIGNVMPAEFSYIDSESETETEKTERGMKRYDADGYWLPETTKSKTKNWKKKNTADMQSTNGRTAAHWAFHGEHYKLMLYLIDQGMANATLADGDGNKSDNMTIKGKPLKDVLSAMRKRGLNRVRS